MTKPEEDFPSLEDYEWKQVGENIYEAQAGYNSGITEDLNINSGFEFIREALTKVYESEDSEVKAWVGEEKTVLEYREDESDRLVEVQEGPNYGSFGVISDPNF